MTQQHGGGGSSLGRRRGRPRPEVVIGVAVLVIVVSAAWWTGAHRLPFSDDWAYLRMQDTLDHTGRIIGVGWNDVSIVGQLEVTRAVDYLLGDTIIASRLVVIVSGLGCLALVARLVRRTRRPELAALCVLCFVAFPGVTTHLVTSMTDLPATALMLGCLAAGIAATRGEGRDRVVALGPLAVAVTCGVAAVTVRQLGATAPIAVVGTLALLPQQPRSRQRVLLVGAVGAAIALGFLRWRAGIDRTAAFASFTPLKSTTAVVRAWSLLGLGLLPLLLATRILAVWRSARHDASLRPFSRRLLTIGPAVWAVVALGVGWRQPVLPTTLVREGPIGTVSLETLPSGVVDGFWVAITVAAAFASTALTAAALVALVRALRGGLSEALRRGLDRPERALPLAFGALSFLVASVSSYLQHALFDRYVFPSLVAGMVLVCGAPTMSVIGAEAASPSGSARRGAVAVAGVLALLAVWSATDQYSLQAARFRGGDVASASGVPVDSIDAGFEFVGLHAPAANPIVLELDQSYLDAFPNFRLCALVTSATTAPPGMAEIGRVHYRGAFGLADRRLQVYAATDCQVLK